MCHRRVIYILLRMEQIKFKFNYLWQVLLIKLESTGLENPCQEVNFRKSKLKRNGNAINLSPTTRS